MCVAGTGGRPLHRADGNVRSGRGSRSEGPRSGRFLRLVALGTHFLVKNAVSFSQVTPADLRSLRCDPCVAASERWSQPWRPGRPLGGCSWWQRSACSVLVVRPQPWRGWCRGRAALASTRPTSCCAACLGVSGTSARSAPPPSTPRSGAFRKNWTSQGRPWERFS